MKKLLTSIIVLYCSFTTLKAQNPFNELGVECEMLTLSKGKFCEFFPNDSVVRIGSVIFNTITNQVTSFVVTDSTNANDLRVQPYVTSRWLSTDPLAEKYMEWSPYNYCKNNPIFFIDSDGRIIDPWYVKTETGIKRNENFKNTSLLTEVYNHVTNLNASNRMFGRVFLQLSNSEKHYQIIQNQKNGSEAGRSIYGTFDKISKIGFAHWDEGGCIKGPDVSTVFEEFFHAGQKDFYENKDKTDLQIETEAKVAQAFSGGENDFGINENLGFYFDAIKSGTVTNEITKKAEYIIKNKIAPAVYDRYKDYWQQTNQTGNDISKYKLSLDYFNYLINK